MKGQTYYASILLIAAIATFFNIVKVKTYINKLYGYLDNNSDLTDNSR